MKIKFPFLFFPALVFFVDSLKPNTIGMANLFFVRILASHKEDKGILAHELNHVKNMYIVSLISFALTLCGVYLFDPLVLMFMGEVNWLNIAMIYAGSLGTYGWLYFFFDTFRFKEECASFRVQSKFDDVDKTKFYARNVADNYKTGYSFDAALAEIRKK